MQISIMEISMSLNGNLSLSWVIKQPGEKSDRNGHLEVCKLLVRNIGDKNLKSNKDFLHIAFESVSKHFY